MKIRAERKALSDTIAWVAQAVPKRPATPALAGIRLTARDGALTVTAFDYDSGHTATVPVEVIGDGEVLVSGRYLAMVMGGLRGKDADLVLDGATLTITSGRSVYRMRPMALEDYPTIPAFTGRVGVIDADALARMVSIVAPPVDDASKHEQTQGVHLESGEYAAADGLWLVGSDGSARSIHVARGPWAQDAPLDATVPAAGLTSAIKGLSGMVEIGFEGGVLSLRDSARSVTLRTFATTYLRGGWRRLLDQTANRGGVIVTTDAAELAGAVKRAAALGDDGRESYVGLVIEADSITIRAGVDAVDGEDVIEAEMADAEGVWFGTNAALLSAALTAIGEGQVALGLANAGEIKGAAVIDLWPLDRDDARFLVMPRTWTGGDPR